MYRVGCKHFCTSKKIITKHDLQISSFDFLCLEHVSCVFGRAPALREGPYFPQTIFQLVVTVAVIHSLWPLAAAPPVQLCSVLLLYKKRAVKKHDSLANVPFISLLTTRATKWRMYKMNCEGNMKLSSSQQFYGRI